MLTRLKSSQLFQTVTELGSTSEILNSDISNNTQNNLNIISNSSETNPQELNNTSSQPVQNLNLTNMNDNLNVLKVLDEKFALNMVIEFDGSSFHDLERFISCCEYVVENLSEADEQKFLRLLHRKLIGRAHDVLIYNSFNNFDELKRELLIQFGQSKSKENLELELLNIKQNFNEDVRKYACRIEQTLSMLNSVCILKEGKEAAKIIRNLNESTAIKSFELGLKEPVRTIILASRFSTLKESINGAIEHESMLSQKHMSIQNFETKPQIKCHLCNKLGHIARNCRSSNNTNFINPNVRANTYSNLNSRTFRPNPQVQTSNFIENNHSYHRNVNVRNINKFCNYCKSSGHIIEECRKLQYNKSKTLTNSNLYDQPQNIVNQTNATNSRIYNQGNENALNTNQMNTGVRVQSLK